MYVCKKCGREYDGNFCPYCGEKREGQNICPQCGNVAESGAKFCSKCGWSFETNSARVSLNKSEKQGLCKAYMLFKYLPAMLFALFTVLLIIFYACPAAVEFGVNVGNIFYVIKDGAQSFDIDYLYPSAVFLIVLWVLCVLCVAATVFLFFKAWNKNVKIGKLQFSYMELCGLAGVLLEFMAFITACVMCGKISAYDEVVGLFKAGACEILIIILGLLFIFAAVGFVVARKIIDMKNSKPAEYEVEIEKAKESKIQQAKAKYIQAKEQYIIEHPAPEKVLNTAKTTIYGREKALRSKHTIVSAAIVILFVFSVLVALNYLLCVDFSDFEGFYIDYGSSLFWKSVDYELEYWGDVAYLFSEHSGYYNEMIFWIIILVVMVALAVVAIFLLPKRTVKQKAFGRVRLVGLYRFFIAIAIIIFIVLIFMLCVIERAYLPIAVALGQYEYYGSVDEYIIYSEAFGLTVFYLIDIAALIVLAVFLNKTNKKQKAITLELFGNVKGHGEMKRSFESLKEEYDIQDEAYRRYKADLKQYKLERKQYLKNIR